MIELIDYHPRYHEAFREMNLQWLNEYGLTESHDLQVLDDPEKFITGPGGALFLAVSGGLVAGSAAMVPESENTMELAKMCVHPDFRGQGLSRRLMQHASTLLMKKNCPGSFSILIINYKGPSGYMKNSVSFMCPYIILLLLPQM